MNIIIITYIFWLGHRKLVSHVVWFYEHKKADYLYQLHKLENVLILLAHWPETSQTLTLAPDDRLRGFTFSGIIDVNPLINNLSKLLIWVFHFTHWWSISTLKSCDGLKSISFTLFWLGHRGILAAISYQIMFPKIYLLGLQARRVKIFKLQFTKSARSRVYWLFMSMQGRTSH